MSVMLLSIIVRDGSTHKVEEICKSAIYSTISEIFICPVSQVKDYRERITGLSVGIFCIANTGKPKISERKVTFIFIGVCGPNGS